MLDSWKEIAVCDCKVVLLCPQASHLHRYILLHCHAIYPAILSNTNLDTEKFKSYFLCPFVDQLSFSRSSFIFLNATVSEPLCSKALCFIFVFKLRYDLHFVAQACHSLTAIYLSRPLQCWDYRYQTVPPAVSSCVHKHCLYSLI